MRRTTHGWRATGVAGALLVQIASTASSAAGWSSRMMTWTRGVSWLVTRLTTPVMLVMITGCGAPPRVETTFLRSVDLVEMTDTMAQSFATTPVIAQRTSDDEPWVISFDRLTNHTNEIIPEREKWLYVARLRALLAQSDVAKENALIWIMPPRYWSMVTDELGEMPPVFRMTPTHQLSAEFTSLTVSSGQGRSDTYLCEYRLVDLSNGALVWNDAWEVKRSIAGVTYD